MKYYTIEETAKELRATPEIVFDIIKNGTLDTDTGNRVRQLHPSIVVNKPVMLQFIKTEETNNNRKLVEVVHINIKSRFKHPIKIMPKSEGYTLPLVYRHFRYYPEALTTYCAWYEEVSGLCFIHNYLKWGTDGWAKVKSLSQHGQIKAGAVVKPFSISKDDLVISAPALEFYMNESGIPVPDHIRQAAAGNKTPEEIQGQSDCKRSDAAAALKSLQTADIDKQIDAVIQVIDAAIRKHLQGKSKSMVVNHIRFLKDVGIDGRKRAKDKVKDYIEKEYSSYGYSVISRRPSTKDDYFVST